MSGDELASQMQDSYNESRTQIRKQGLLTTVFQSTIHPDGIVDRRPIPFREMIALDDVHALPDTLFSDVRLPFPEWLAVNLYAGYEAYPWDTRFPCVVMRHEGTGASFALSTLGEITGDLVAVASSSSEVLTMYTFTLRDTLLYADEKQDHAYSKAFLENKGADLSTYTDCAMYVVWGRSTPEEPETAVNDDFRTREPPVPLFDNTMPLDKLIKFQQNQIQSAKTKLVEDVSTEHIYGLVNTVAHYALSPLSLLNGGSIPVFAHNSTSFYATSYSKLHLAVLRITAPEIYETLSTILLLRAAPLSMNAYIEYLIKIDASFQANLVSLAIN